MISLLTTSEAIAYGPGDVHLSPDRVREALPVQEENLFNERFGWQFYEVLQMDRIVYTLRGEGEPAQVNTTDRRYRYYTTTATDYVIGDYVLARDQVYQVIRPVDTAGIPVANVDYYRPAPKFATACLESLWERYLRRILATATVRACVATATFQVSSRGGVKLYKEGESKPLTLAEVAALKSELLDANETSIRNMERFIRRSDGTCYALYGKTHPDTTDACTGTDTGLITPTKSPGSGRRRTFGFSL